MGGSRGTALGEEIKYGVSRRDKGIKGYHLGDKRETFTTKGDLGQLTKEVDLRQLMVHYLRRDICPCLPLAQWNASKYCESDVALNYTARMDQPQNPLMCTICVPQNTH